MLTLTIATADAAISGASAVAIGDLAAAIRPVRWNEMPEARPAITAGLHYPTAWTRDAAINAWNAGSLLAPEAAATALRAVAQLDPDGWRLPHPDYYDSVVWLSGAWAHACASGDRDFLATACAIGSDCMARWEREEFDPATGLFRGGSFFNDGVSAYPERYARPTEGWGNIRDWLKDNPRRHPLGGGLPMATLSTNCLYLLGYRALGSLFRAAGRTPDPAWAQRAAGLHQSIRRHFWDDGAGRLRYLVDPWGVDERQEIGGWAFARLAGVVTAAEAVRLSADLRRVPAGIPCLWPPYERYSVLGGVGRHSGLIWPQVVALWGETCARDGDAWGVERELLSLAGHANRDGQFTECYHPLSGLPDGGLQERDDGTIRTWGSCHRTTWGATGYLRMLLRGVVGLRDDWEGVSFVPCLPARMAPLEIGDLTWRGLRFDLRLTGSGSRVVQATVDGKRVETLRFAAADSGRRRIEIELA